MAKKMVQLIFPEKLVKEPVTFQMAKKFDVMPNIRRAKVTEKAGEIILDLEGKEENIEKGIKFLIRKGVEVEPIVGDVLEL